MNTDEIINILLSKLEANHAALIKIAADKKYTNYFNPDIQKIFEERQQLFNDLQKFKSIVSANK